MTRQIAENKTRNNRKRKVIDEMLDIEKTSKYYTNQQKNMQIKLTIQVGFDCCQVKQYDKECKGQTENSRNS